MRNPLKGLKLLNVMRRWRPRRFRLAGRLRPLLAIAAALLLSTAIGGLMMIMLGGDGTPAPAAGQIVYGELERDPALFERVEVADSPNADAHQDEAAVAHPPADDELAATESARDAALPEVSRLFGLDEQGPLPPGLEAVPTGAPRASVDPDLLESGIGGKLPIVSPDGLRPLEAYSRPLSPSTLPMVTIIVQDLGLDPKLSADSVLLPDEIALGFSPYMAHGAAWHRYARGHGHETVLSLPVAHPVSAYRDEGPLALDPAWSDDELLTGLRRVLVRGAGYVAVTARPGLFAAERGRWQPIAAELLHRGIGLVELGDGQETVPPPVAELPFAQARVDLDRVLTPAGIENQLQLLERMAEVEGRAIGFTKPYPLVFDRIWQWSQSLDRNRIALVPLSTLLAG